MRLSIPPNTVPPSLSDVQDALARLRAEVELTDSAEQKATLLLELGILQELGRDDHGAAKDLLGAINAGNLLREPVERLVFLIERRRSYKNLGKLLDRLGRVANNADEIVRAQLARGEFLTDQNPDFPAAREALEVAARSAPSDASVWLSAQFLAAKSNDSELMVRALEARVELAQDPSYRALLSLHLAAAQSADGLLEAAQRTLETPVAAASEYRFAALGALLGSARTNQHEALVASCLASQAELLSLSLGDPEQARQSGVPVYFRTKQSAADAWLRAAHSSLALGDNARAAAHFARAGDLLPQSVAIAYAEMQALEASGDMTAAVVVARRILHEGQLAGSAKAALSLRVANAELAGGALDEALTALSEALEADPRSVPARALQLNLLQQTDRAAALAAAVGSLAAGQPGARGKGRYWLLAAFLHAYRAKDTLQAKSALRSAAGSGVPALTLLRVGRMLATLVGDVSWETECVSQLVKQLKGLEQASVRLQLSRTSWLAGHDNLAGEQLAALSHAGPGQWAASVLLAYGGLDSANSAKALLGLAKEQKDREVAAALRLLVAYRAGREGHAISARNTLEAVQEEHPADPVAALQLATLLIKADQPHAAAEALATTATATEHLDVAQAFLLQAGFLHWRNDQRESAVRCFEQAQELNPKATASLLAWALRSAKPDLPEARRRALTTAQGAEADADLNVLERFALEVGLSQHRADATAALDQADEVGLGDVGDAVQLTRALWPQSAGHGDALSSLDSRSKSGLRVARALEFARARQDRSIDVEELADCSLQWAETESLPALLEALAAVQAAGRVDDETKIRRMIANHLEGEGRDALLASASIVRLLSSPGFPEPVVGSSPQIRLTNSELAYPGSDPARRASALIELDDLAGDDAKNLNLLLIGMNQLAAADHEAALRSFIAAESVFPDDIAVHMGQRDAAKVLGDRAVEARASFRMAELSSVPAEAGALFRQAATLWLDELGQSELGFQALGHAVANDYTHAEAFQRLFRWVRDQGDHERLLVLSAARLEVAKDVPEITKLYWERARACRALKRTDEALLELSNVRLLDPAHVGAMALGAEVHLTLGQHAEAAKQLADLAAHPDAPSEQRLMSGMAAVDLYETKLEDLSSALGVLAILKEAKLSTLPVRERLARAAAKAARWEDAARLLEELMAQRETPEGRIEAARLALAIYRDRLDDPSRALSACRCLLAEAPQDAEAIDLVLDEVFEEEPTQELLEGARSALVQVCTAALDSEKVARLARVAEYLEDLPLRQGCLGVLVTLGINSEELRAELRALDARCHHHPQMAISNEMLDGPLLRDAEGPAAELLSHLAPTLSSVIGPSLKSLGVGRKHRVKAQSGSALRGEIAHWAGAFGLGEFELYVGGPDPDGIFTVPDEKLPAFVVGQDVQEPFGPGVRQRLATRVFALSRGFDVLLSRESSDVAALLVAACEVCAVKVESPAFALVGEFQRLLAKELPRRVKKEMLQSATDLAAAKPDLVVWAEAALSGLQSVGALAVGDPSWVLLSARERLSRERNVDSQTEKLRARVLSATLAESFRQLREQLGLAAK